MGKPLTFWMRTMLLLAGAGLAGCGGGDGGGGTGAATAAPGTTVSAPPAVPRVNFVSPQRVVAAGPDFELRAYGSNLTARSVLRWNAADRPTRFVSDREIVASIPSSDIGRAGRAEITVFTPDGGGSSPIQFAIAADESECFLPWRLEVVPAGNWAFLASGGCSPERSGILVPYSVDPDSGELERAATAFQQIGAYPSFVVVDPLGRFVYTGHGSEDSSATRVIGFRIDAATGTLTPAGSLGGFCPPPAGTPCHPVSLSFEPSGRFAYVVSGHRAADGSSVTSVATLRVDAVSGALGLLGLSTSPGIARPLRIDRQGRFAFQPVPGGSAAGAAAQPSGRVVTYAIDPTNGSLGIVGSAPTSLWPAAIAIDPGGQHAIAANRESADLGIYAIDAATGALSEQGRIATVRSPDDVQVHPSGKFVYVVSPFLLEVWNYTLDARRGELASVGSIKARGYLDLDAAHLSLDPVGRFAYVVIDGEVQTYSIDADSGSLRRTGVLSR